MLSYLHVNENPVSEFKFPKVFSYHKSCDEKPYWCSTHETTEIQTDIIKLNHFLSACRSFTRLGENTFFFLQKAVISSNSLTLSLSPLLSVFRLAHMNLWASTSSAPATDRPLHKKWHNKFIYFLTTCGYI